LAVAVLRKKYLGAWPLIIWEATTAKQNYYRTNQKFGRGMDKIWGPVPPGLSLKSPLLVGC